MVQRAPQRVDQPRRRGRDCSRRHVACHGRQRRHRTDLEFGPLCRPGPVGWPPPCGAWVPGWLRASLRQKIGERCRQQPNTAVGVPFAFATDEIHIWDSRANLVVLNVCADAGARRGTGPARWDTNSAVTWACGARAGTRRHSGTRDDGFTRRPLPIAPPRLISSRDPTGATSSGRGGLGDGPADPLRQGRRDKSDRQ